MERVLGKNQSYCREINFELVIDLLRKEPRSATQLADTLKLSNATMSSIIKDLLDLGMIDVAKSMSVKGSGRKQVFYTLNEKFGLILIINMVHHRADISITNIKEESIISDSMTIDEIDEDSTQKVILKANELLFNSHSDAQLKNIVISISGLVKDKTEGSEKHFVQAAFEKQFHNVPTYLTNDGNLITYGELSKGALANCNNGAVVLLDYGIGGSFVANKELFRGDNGYSGEMGFLLCENNGKLEYLEDVASLRILLDKAGNVVNRKLKMEDLFELYKTNNDIHQMVIESANKVGKALRSLIAVTDISNIVLAGRVAKFGDDYINEDILALLTWYNVVSILPGTLTGLGILGTFIGLILGINTIGFGSVDAALESVQGLLKGINIAFYTSISGVILSILFNISYSILRNILFCRLCDYCDSNQL